ncbi:unnamed protein product [Orchesella dallaii]|uniref:3'-5' exonuclease domain-containing protein n=1 Tax=Orchesella dallaii TaxID=48710 RepID=A0ABP1S232_9HEXA
MQNIQGNQLTQARIRWGTQRIRPHSSISGFLDWRKRINTASSNERTVHPYERIIQEWRMTNTMVATTSLSFPRIFKYVRTESELIECSIELENHSEMTVDTEMNTESYYHLICVIQFSTSTTDYVIDAFTLFSKIKENLGTILENPTKLKIFHSGNDLIHLQRM